MSFSFTADDEHCICVRNIQLNFISVYCQHKGFIPILNYFTFNSVRFKEIEYNVHQFAQIFSPK